MDNPCNKANDLPLISAGQVTPEWLTVLLREQGVLTHGVVKAVTPGQVQTTFASAVQHLEVSYSQDASTSAPLKLFLKLANPALAPGEFDPTQVHQEIIFYRDIAPVMGESFTIPCYSAAFNPDTGVSHILLKDVSETHTPCLTPSCQENCELAIDCLARLHAFWWDHPHLGTEIGRFPTPEERQQDCIDAEKSATAFMAALGDQLRPAWRSAYETVLAALPRLFKRHATGRNLTLVHGDAHLGNFLFPRDLKTAGAYLLDWQFWHPTIGGTDLAFMMATEWEAQTRRLLEQRLLRRYHAHLLAQGVQGYAWDDCWNDYRLSVILVSIFIPVWRWAVFKWAPDLPTLESSMTAYADLQCSDLVSQA
jgi:hypothetical protein